MRPCVRSAEHADRIRVKRLDLRVLLDGARYAEFPWLSPLPNAFDMAGAAALGAYHLSRAWTIQGLHVFARKLQIVETAFRAAGRVRAVERLRMLSRVRR